MKAMWRATVKMAAAMLAATAVAGGIGGPAVYGAGAGDAVANKAPADTVLDHNSLWRYFNVSRCSYARTADGTLEPRDIYWYWGGIRSKPAPSTASSPLPPADWAGPAFDDSLWPRVRLPQPVLTVAGANPRPFYLPYATAAVVLRGTFEVTDPALVRSCALSLDYWGGAVVYVNGTEAARGHVPGDTPNLQAVAEDYPLEAFTTPDGKPLRVGDAKNQDRLALRERRLADVTIPAGLLRKGVNVLAIEVHQAPVPEIIARGVGQELSRCGWPPIGLLDATLTVSPAGAVTPNLQRPKGIQVWNCAPYDTITAFDYGDPLEPLRPIAVFAAPNGVFSGRLAVSSDQAITGLKVTVTDLALPEGGAKIPASAVRVRYAEPAVAGKSWAPPYRFDGLRDAIPAEIPVIAAPPPRENYFGQTVDRKGLTAGAVASLWLTVRVPKDAKPGTYEGTVTVTAEGLKPTIVPLRVSVSAWSLPDPKDFRVTNFVQTSPDSLAKHYGVPRWSEKHFELMAKSMTLMAQVNSRQAIAELCVDFYGLGGNAESMIRWIRKQGPGARGQGSGIRGQGSGVRDQGASGAEKPETRNLTPETYSYDFTVFDRYLDMVAKTIGKPLPLRLNCWGEWAPGKTTPSAWRGPSKVSLLDPATGTLDVLEQPTPEKPEFVAFWKPVLDEVRKRVEARGWWDVTAMGHNSYCWHVHPMVVDAYHAIWPDGVWSYTAHNGRLGGRFTGTEKTVSMPVRYADTVWGHGRSTPRGYGALLKPRPGFWCFTYRGCFHDNSPLTDLRRIDEDQIMMGHDGVSDFGADFLPVKRADGRRYLCVGNGRGTGGPNNSTRSLLAPGPDGPIATERFEMFREGLQLAEAILFIQRAIEEKKISGDLAQRANRYLDARGEAFVKGWFGVRYMQAEQDEKLLGLAGEVARTLE